MIIFTIAIIGLGISIAGMGILIYRHRNTVSVEGVDEDAVLRETEHPPLFFEEFFAVLKTRGMIFWQTNLRDHVLHGSEKMLAWCEDAFKRIAAFLRLLRSRIRHRQINGGTQEDRYWRNLNSWNARRLKLRLRRKKTAEEE